MVSFLKCFYVNIENFITIEPRYPTHPHLEPQDPLIPSHSNQHYQIDDETMRLLSEDNVLIAREYLTLGKVIGEGQFGSVSMGVLDVPGCENPIEVAVKSLRSKSEFFICI